MIYLYMNILQSVHGTNHSTRMSILFGKMLTKELKVSQKKSWEFLNLVHKVFCQNQNVLRTTFLTKPKKYDNSKIAPSPFHDKCSPLPPASPASCYFANILFFYLTLKINMFRLPSPDKLLHFQIWKLYHFLL